jgi:hypothetical protein
VLEARDIDHAVALMSKHPGVRHGFPFEIRPIDEDALEHQVAAVAKYRPAEGVPLNPDAGATKFGCLGYVGECEWGASAKGDMEAMLKECIAFDEARHRAGQWLSGVALQGVQTAKTLRSQGGHVVVLDGPYAETTEWLEGIVVLALKDMHHAVDVLSSHPALRVGVAIEIRPIDEETSARWETRRNRSMRGAASRGGATGA